MSLQIELAALRLIHERGLENVTVEQVAAAAGLSVRSFYRYFFNVSDVLTGVAKRQTDWLCLMIARRPEDEHILDSFRSVFEQPDEAGLPVEITDVRDEAAEALELWGEIVRRDPEDMAIRSHAVSYMTARYEELIRARLGLDEGDDTAGVIAAALAGVVWFVYVRWVEEGGASSLYASLEAAFESVRAVLGGVPAQPSTRR
jgi:AcrR family transcriptional regulator